MSDKFFKIVPLYWCIEENKYKEQTGHVFIIQSEIKQVLFPDNCDHASIATSEGSIQISKERALEIVNIIENQ